MKVPLRYRLMGFVCGLIFTFFRAGHHNMPAKTGELVVRQELSRVVFVWNGPVEPPMKERFEEAFAKLGSGPRRVLISFDSPGGHVLHGQEVVAVIRKAVQVHYIDTTVDAGKMCASMCLSLYLSGVDRFAHPSANFMFHQVSLQLKPENERALRELTLYALAGAIESVKQKAISYATDKLFDDEFENKLNNKWLEGMRERSRRGDVWLTGRQLVTEKSGVVDTLL